MAAAAAATARCLSDLPDELLQRILFFVPRREAASTAMLSRRWRSLWRASGVVYLDSRYFEKEQDEELAGFPPWMSTAQPQDRKDFLHGVEQALAAASTAPITKLTLVVKKRGMHVPEEHNDLVGAVMSSRAARHVKELHVEVKDSNRQSLTFGSLASEALRVLHLTECSPMAGAAAAFPRLAELHLHKCNVFLSDLKLVTDAAPLLATLHIESSLLSEKYDCNMPWGARCYRLICPAVTALLFADCRFQIMDELSLELDAPGLEYFTFKGAVQICNQFLLKPPTQSNNMIHVDLHLMDRGQKVSLPSLFWKFIQNFSTTKLLKLKLDFSMDRVFPCGPSTLFGRLERLELDAQYNPTGEAWMSTLASLLHCCPVVRDLQLKLIKDGMSMIHTRFSIDQEARADFDKSVDRFRHRCRSPKHSFDGEDDDSYEASYIPVLSEQSFRCLESCLRRVSLHFCMDKPNCLGVKLAKFFADKAVVLEELHIDDGSHKMLDHINVCVSDKMDC